MGRPPLIDRDGVLDAAMALADESGLEAVTMQAVASRLGVTPMALYRPVGDKAALLDGLVERLLLDVAPPSPGLTGPEQLVEMAHALRATGQRHPGVFPLLLTRPAATPQALGVRAAALGALEVAGIPPDRVAQAERLVSTAVLGFIVSEVAGRFRDHRAEVLDADFERLLEVLGHSVMAPPDARPARADPSNR